MTDTSTEAVERLATVIAARKYRNSRHDIQRAADTLRAFATERDQLRAQLRQHHSKTICPECQKHMPAGTNPVGDLSDLKVIAEIVAQQRARLSLRVKALAWVKDDQGDYKAECPVFGSFEVVRDDGWLGFVDDELIVSAGKEIIGEDTTHADDIGFDSEQEALAKVAAWRQRRLSLCHEPAPEPQSWPQQALDAVDSFMSGGTLTDDQNALQDLVHKAGYYAATAYDAHAPKSGGECHALTRAFLLALIDPLHKDLDYLRADPAAGEAARAAAIRSQGEN